MKEIAPVLLRMIGNGSLSLNGATRKVLDSKHRSHQTIFGVSNSMLSHRFVKEWLLLTQQEH